MDGVNRHCQVICNPLYTAHFTTGREDRLTVVDCELGRLSQRIYFSATP
jgi:hypothetical protein